MAAVNNSGNPTFVVFSAPDFDTNWACFLQTHAAVSTFFALPNDKGTRYLIQPLRATDGHTLVLIVPDSLLNELPSGVRLQHLPGLESAMFYGELPDGLTLDYTTELVPPDEL